MTRSFDLLPDGRLYQVEYARESVKRGTTTVGLKYKEGVILIVDKRISNSSIIIDSNEKMYNVDDHMTSGLNADARQLVDRARVRCQMNKMTYGDAIPVTTLVKKMCDHKQSFTHDGGGGHMDCGSSSLESTQTASTSSRQTHPGPTNFYHAGAIGKGRSEVIEYFEENWKPGLTLTLPPRWALPP